MYYVNHYVLERLERFSFRNYLKMCAIYIYTVKTKLKALNTLPNIPSRFIELHHLNQQHY